MDLVEHAQDTFIDVNLTTDVQFPIDSERDSHWDDETGTHFEGLNVMSLRPGEMLALVETIKSDTCTLHMLDLHESEVGDDGARALAEALRSATCTLHTLHLGSNGVGDEGARALAEALRSDTCTLHTLDLGDNGVGADGARALAEALRSETCTLHTLDLGSNGVGDDGARALAEALRSDTCTLHTLHLNIDAVSDDCARVLDEAQALCRTRRRCRHHGLLRAIVMLAILRKRACEAVFHPKRLRREGVFDAWAHEG